MQRRGVEIFVSAILLLTCVLVIYRVYAFGQERFFTVDEYQYAHATWLVSEGDRPYVDFYEHHFPLSYVIHAPVLWLDGSFPEQALRLRAVVFTWWIAAMVAVGLCVRTKTGDDRAALLSVILALSLGFSLMSAVDYRADNFGAFLLLLGCAMLETNRGPKARRLRAACSGILLGLAVGMTQKMVFFAGGSVALWLGADALLARRSGRNPFVAFPSVFVLGLLGVLVLGLGWLMAEGLLAPAWEITIVQAIRHEIFYPAVSAYAYIEPFFRTAPVSTSAIVLCVGAYFVLSRDAFWAIPLFVALLGGILLKAQYPYNYVFFCIAMAVLAARGVGLAVGLLESNAGKARRFVPVLYLLPLLLLPSQWRFVSGTTTNEHQLAILEKIERFSDPDEVVIDNSGGALFRPHASYYYHHGDAHRAMFDEYFRNDLIDDYRRSRALLWIMDYRLLDLPTKVHQYFLNHYVRADGSLFGLGFHLRHTGEAGHSMLIDVIREGDYHVFPAPVRLSMALGTALRKDREYDFLVDGTPVKGPRVHLEEGEYEIEMLPNSPGYYVTLLSPDAFLRSEGERFDREMDGADSYQLLFEYEER